MRRPIKQAGAIATIDSASSVEQELPLPQRIDAATAATASAPSDVAKARNTRAADRSLDMHYHWPPVDASIIENNC